MGTTVYFLQYLSFPIYITLLLQIVLGGILYLLFSVLTKNESFFYILGILRNNKRGIK